MKGVPIRSPWSGYTVWCCALVLLSLNVRAQPSDGEWPCGEVEVTACTGESNLTPSSSELCQLEQSGEDVYRFSWIRSFHPPIIIDVRKSKSDHRLFARRYEGAGSYDWGEVAEEQSVSISEDEWYRLESKLNRVRFWMYRAISLEELWETGQVGVTIDGAAWVAEGVEDGQYRSLSCQSPEAERGAGAGRFLKAWGLHLLEKAEMISDDPSLIY